MILLSPVRDLTLADEIQKCQEGALYSRPPMSERRKTVLIVDDDEGMRDTLSAVLRRDFRVLKTAAGETALQIMEKEDVDLMMIDVRLPGISGIEVLKIVKENYPYVCLLYTSPSPRDS